MATHIYRDAAFDDNLAGKILENCDRMTLNKCLDVGSIKVQFQ